MLSVQSAFKIHPWIPQEMPYIFLSAGEEWLAGNEKRFSYEVKGQKWLDPNRTPSLLGPLNIESEALKNWHACMLAAFIWSPQEHKELQRKHLLISPLKRSQHANGNPPTRNDVLREACHVEIRRCWFTAGCFSCSSLHLPRELKAMSKPSTWSPRILPEWRR